MLRRRHKRVAELRAARTAELQGLPREEREYHANVASSTERTLALQHSERAGCHYPPSGGIERRGKLFIPWPLPHVDIPFDERLLDADDSEAESASDDEESPPPVGMTLRSRVVGSAPALACAPTLGRARQRVRRRLDSTT